MKASDIGNLARRHWLPVVLATIAGLVLGAGMAMTTATTYTSTSSLIINPGAPAKGVDVANLNTFITSRMESYDALAESAMVINPVIDALKLNEDVATVEDRLSFSIPTGSTIINVTASGADEASAVALSNAVTKSLGEAVVKTTPAQSTGTASVGTIVIQDGKDAVGVQASSVPINAAGGALLGFLASVGIFALVDWFVARRRGGLRRGPHAKA